MPDPGDPNPPLLRASNRPTPPEPGSQSASPEPSTLSGESPDQPTNPPLAGAEPLAGAPPVPPTLPPAPSPRTSPPPSPWRRAIAAIAVVATVAVGGALLGSSVRGGSMFSNGSSSASNAAPSASSFDTPSDSTDNGSVASNVSTAIVNITTTLANGAGEGAGTGMLISGSGEVLTNNHVVENADTISVEIGGNGSSHSAKVIGYDMRDDVALLKVDGVSGLDTIPVGNPDNVVVDDPIVVVGNALGRGGDPSSTSGTVTGVDRQITATDSDGSNAETLTNLIQVQADVQPGDSGGAVVDSSGKVIGMTTAASTNGFRFREDAAGVGFAIRIDKALSIAKQIQNGQEVDGVHVGARALLGVAIQDSSQSGRDGGASSSGGAVVTSVGSDTPASSAGIEQGDVITAIDNTTVRSSNDLQDALNAYHPDDKVKVTWTDGSGNSKSETVKLIEGPPA
jgi:S1-C subfamily serine protease